MRLLLLTLCILLGGNNLHLEAKKHFYGAQNETYIED